MRYLLLIAIVGHQSRYFKQLLERTGFSGAVLTAAGLMRYWRPFVRSGVDASTHRHIVHEKLVERRAKGKTIPFYYPVAIHIEQRMVAVALKRLILAHRGRVVIGVWNGGHRYHKLAAELTTRHGGRMLYFENGLLPGTTTLDPKGVNYNNSVPGDPAFYRNPQLCREEPDIGDIIPRKALRQKGAAVRLPEHFVFCPFQDDRDTQVRLHSPWVHGMRDLFKVMSAASETLGLTVIFKEHPSSPIDYPGLHDQVTDHARFANGNDTRELIEKSDAVITLNSTVGLEALVLKKKVLVLGNAFYDIPGLTMSAQSRDALINCLREMPDWKPDEELRRGFLNYLSRQYCVRGSWQHPDAAHWESVRQHLLPFLSQATPDAETPEKAP